MKGTLLYNNPNWTVKHISQNNIITIYPLEPQSMLTHKCKPNMNVTFQLTKQGKAKLTHEK